MEKVNFNIIELAEYLGVGRATAYNLTNTEGFPTFRVGRRIMVNKDALDKWIAAGGQRNLGRYANDKEPDADYEGLLSMWSENES